MTIEMAADLVIAMKIADKNNNFLNKQVGIEPTYNAEELFGFFVDYFKMNMDQITNFAELCMYPIATNAEIE